jgi:hypothetical protein
LFRGSEQEQYEFIGRPVSIGKPCPDCRALIGSPIAIEPHISLRMETTAAVGLDTSHVYKCHACGYRLLREGKAADPSSRWRLF